ncbi:hexaprenyl pyrophosphate synthase [Sulfuracidifex tepidarius]|uniref:Hexaprenyl pyrophosphate synthase n=1 Tax=Sulfuracidifex tepidarius TaxID=1294262 RepID=A0A510E6X3_9CREN|nr:hexaprenyl pyrophosphate synthase [Sulfuracidifex tepidarius]BBG25393.1 Hexaprenyl pyrophosphate synthase [Sulfuracidifex tepidarius]BBG28187.1 Hexaprenyl pyrophosphate synthase [Sulfuracidifex tepidarius]
MSLLEFWGKTKSTIDLMIEDFLKGVKEWEVLDMSNYIMKDGKRFRGTLTLFFTEALGGSLESALKGAVATEILHSASLALDDIVDYDVTRRGDKSAWLVYGNRKVIFVTNFLIPTALNMISSYGEIALNTSINLWRDTAVGALKDLYGKSEEYELTIDLKTSSLFKLSTCIASFASKRVDLLDSLLEMGRLLGVMYQIIDDYIDIRTVKPGQLVGSARQLYDLTGDKAEEYVKTNFTKYKETYLNITKSLPFIQKFRNDIEQMPDFLVTGLLNEAGIDSF